MKKKTVFRRLGAMLMTLAMALSLMAIPVFAAETTTFDPTTLTVKKAVAGTTYDVYSVLTLAGKSTDGGKATYRYSYDAGMKDTLAGLIGEGSDYEFTKHTSGDKDAAHVHAGFVIDGNYVSFLVEQRKADGDVDDSADLNGVYYAWTNSAEGQAFATNFASDLRAAVMEATPGSLTTVTTVTAVAANAEGELEPNEQKLSADGTLTISGIPAGYILVVSSAGNSSMLFTADGTAAAIVEKNQAPGLEKETWDAATRAYGDKNDAAVGDVVEFRAVIDAGFGLDKLNFIDTMADGLEFDEFWGIMFYPRKADGTEPSINDKVSDGSSDAVQKNRAVAIDSVSDADEDQSGYVGDGTKYAGGVTLFSVDENDPQYEDKLNLTDTFSNSILTVGRNLADEGDGNTITVNFSEAWLQSKRSAGTWDTEVTSGTAFNEDAIIHNDSRLAGKNDDVPGLGDGDIDTTGARYNMYVGDVETPDDDGGKIVISYTAKITDEALVIGEDGNVNTAHLEYHNNSNVDQGLTPTADRTTRTYVYKLDVLKTVLGSDEILPGAEFELRRAGAMQIDKNWVKDGDPMKLVIPQATVEAKELEVDGKAAMYFLHDIQEGTYTALKASRELTEEEAAAKVDGKADARYEITQTLVSGSDGAINIIGVDSDLYRLKETKAPDGYLLATDPFTVIIGSVGTGSATVAADGKVTMHAYVDPALVDGNDESSKNYEFKASAVDRINNDGVTMIVANASGLLMPDTGGIGTTIFYVVGIAMILGAAVLLIVKRRASRAED